MNDLELCPFCNGSARVKALVSVNWKQKQTLYGVECTECGAAIPTRYIYEHDARSAWNRRVNNE